MLPEHPITELFGKGLFSSQTAMYAISAAAFANQFITVLTEEYASLNRALKDQPEAKGILDKIKLRLIKDTWPHTNYGLNQFVELTMTPQFFSFDFKTPTGPPITDARLMFWFAPYDSPGDDYIIDAVKIEEKAGGMTKTSRTRTDRRMR